MTFVTNEHGKPVTLFFGKRWPNELVDSVARAVVAIHAHLWENIAPLTAEGATSGEERRGSHDPLAPIGREPNLMQQYIWD